MLETKRLNFENEELLVFKKTYTNQTNQKLHQMQGCIDQLRAEKEVISKEYDNL